MPNKQKIKITEENVRKLVDLLKFGLSAGGGKNVAGEMCIEQLVSVAIEGDKKEMPSDAPKCVHQDVNALKIELNDREWSSNKARAKGMAKIAIAQLGSVQIKDEVWERCLWQALNTAITKTPAFRKKVGKIPSEATLAKAFSGITPEGKDARNEVSNYLINVDRIARDININNDVVGSLTVLRLISQRAGIVFKTEDAELRWMADVILDALVRAKSPGVGYLYLLDKKQEVTPKIVEK